MNPFAEEKQRRTGGNPFTEAKSRLETAEPQPAYQSGIFPLTRYDDGEIRFDSDAGIVGAIKRAVNLPGEVMRGEVNPTSDEGIGRAAEMALITSPATPSVRNATAGAGVFSKSYKPKVKAPTAEELKSAATPVYQQLDNAGTEFSVKSVDDLATAIQNELIQSKAIGEEMAPKTFSLLKKFQNAPQGSTSVPYATGLNAARKQLGRRGAKPDLNNPDDPAAASYAARRIMEWFEGGGNSGVVSGPSIPADLLKKANQNYAASKRSDLLQGKIHDAELKASAANSGKNVGNAVRQRIAGLLTNKSAHKDRVGFTERELGSLEKVVEGSATANIARDVGNNLGGGGGLGQSVTSGIGGAAGFALAGYPGAVAGSAGTYLTGKGARALGNTLSKRALTKVDEATRKRSPLYDETVASTPMKTLTADTRQAIAKAILTELLREGRYSAPTDADLSLR